MIRLFEDKNPNIVNIGTKDAPIFNIASDKDLDIYISSSDDSSYSKITFNISGNGLVSILEICDGLTSKLEMNLMNHARVNHSIAFFNGNNEIDYVINEGEGAEYNGALADFTRGNEKFNFVCNLNGDNSRAIWNLASLSNGKDQKTFYVSFFHYGKHTYANMKNYGVCEGESSLNFFGTSSIEKGAKASATHQSAKIMIFDKNCKAKASPVLKIDENDVEASHAAIVGQINEDHIYYLLTRGIKEDDAKKLITLGYLNPIIRFFKDEDVISKIKESIDGGF